MIVNVRLELSDEQRKRFADVIDGKESARLATRKDVSAFVQAAAMVVATSAPGQEPKTTGKPWLDVSTPGARVNRLKPLTQAEQDDERRLRDKLRDMGKDEDYVDAYLYGYIHTGRAIGRTGYAK